MTTNQINYFKAKVEQAHYARADSENQRHNWATEQLSSESNVIAKEHYERSDTESQRHNLEQESIGRFSNEIAQYNAVTGRLNLYETTRHNSVTENLQAQSNAIQASNAQANLMNAATNAFSAAESQRHNIVSEDISNRTTLSTVALNEAEMARKSSEVEVNKAKMENISADTNYKLNQAGNLQYQNQKIISEIHLNEANTEGTQMRNDYYKPMATANLVGAWLGNVSDANKLAVSPILDSAQIGSKIMQYALN